MKNLLAKSNGYLLYDHLIETAEKCYEMASIITNDESWREYAYFCGLFHDLGKSDEKIQNFLKDENVKSPFEHGYLSALLMVGNNPIISLTKRNGNKLNNNINDVIKRVILHHHPLEDKKEEVRNEITCIDDNIIALLGEIKKYTEEKHPDFKFKIKINNKTDIDSEIDCEYFYKHLEDDIKEKNIIFFFLRSVLSLSDVLTSSKYLNLENLINVNIDLNLIKKPEHYDDRFFEQNKIAQELLNHKMCLFNATTGFGKTMLGVLYAIYSQKKTYWVCPRNVITESVYDNVVNEIKALNLNISVSCMTGGVYKHFYNCTENDLKCKNADITIINIDSYFRPCFNTDANMGHSAFINSTVIFDEYHEYFDDCAIMSLFDIARKTRNKLNNNVKTLLLSATQNDYLVDIKNENIKIFKPKSEEKLLNKKYNIKYNDVVNINSFENLKNTNSIVFTNSVKLTQELKKLEYVDDCIHSLFIDDDRKIKFDNLFFYHSKHSNNKQYSFSSTSIVGTGCDISFQNACFIMATPYTLLQQIGRVNRFNECTEIPILTFISTIEGNNLLYKSEYKTVDICSSNEIVLKFYDFLKRNLKEGVHTLKEIYEVVYEFINNYAKLEFIKLKRENNEKSGKHLIELNYSYSNKKGLNMSDDGVIYLSGKNNLRTLNSRRIFIQNNKMKTPMQLDLDLYESVIRNNWEKNNREIEKNYINKGIHKKKWKAKIDNLISEAKGNDKPFCFVNDSRSLFYTEKYGLEINNSKK